MALLVLIGLLALEAPDTLNHLINPERSFSSPEQTAVHLIRESKQELRSAIRWVGHTIKKGDTLAAIWRQYGASTSDAQKTAEAIKASLGKNLVLRSGQELKLQIDPTGHITGLRTDLTEGKSVEVEAQSDGAVVAKLNEPELTEVERVTSGVIETSLAAAAARKSLPYDIVDDTVDLFGSRIEFQREIQPGDSFVIKYIERRTPDGRVVDVGPILMASIRTGGHDFVALRWAAKPNSGAQYFDERGEALGGYFLRYPLKFTRISSVFTSARFHPILQRFRPHNGVDFAAPTGTPVRVVGDGIIESAGWQSGGAGIGIKVRHSPRWSTVYFHLSSVAHGLHAGQRVMRGQVIGAVGMTGLATGPHLHFGLFDRGKYVNPLGKELPHLTVEQPLPPDVLRAAMDALSKIHNETAMNSPKPASNSVG